MHAHKSEHQRQETIQRFRVGEIWVLICTDLLSRGIDFKGVNMVSKIIIMIIIIIMMMIKMTKMMRIM